MKNDSKIQPGLAVMVKDTMTEAEIDSRLDKLNNLCYERVGLTLRPEMVAIKCESGQSAKFAALVEAVKNKTDANIILMCADPAVLADAVKVCADRRPLIYAATKENVDKLAVLAKESNCPVAVKGETLDEVAALTDQLGKAGIKDIVIDAGARKIQASIRTTDFYS